MASPGDAPSATPRLVHAFNLAALTVFWIIFAVGFIIHSVRDTTLVLIGLTASLAAYYALRKHSTAMGICFILAQTLFFYCLACESLFFLENTFRFNISRRLELSARLQKKAASKLKEERNDFFENLGDDPLFYRRTPGSKHRYQYDNDPKNTMYEATVDETGYLNLNRGAYDASPQVDIFISGDSVLQGTGMPSALDEVRRTAPFTLWNLSTGSYSPRQKVKALTTFGLPKNPKLLVVEFYSGNDASEIIEDEILAGSGTFEERFAFAGLYARLLKSDTYGPLLISPGASILWYLKTSNLTFALNYYMIRHVKHAAGKLLKMAPSSAEHVTAPDHSASATDQGRPIALPAYSHFTVKPDRFREWIALGITATLKQYDLLLSEVSRAAAAPKIAILYNPTSYEIYQGILIDPDPEQDERARMQREALREYAAAKGILFVDLLPNFRKAVSGSPPLWLYGKTDPVHWSAVGTKTAAKILGPALEGALKAGSPAH